MVIKQRRLEKGMNLEIWERMVSQPLTYEDTIIIILCEEETIKEVEILEARKKKKLLVNLLIQPKSMVVQSLKVLISNKSVK